MKKSQERKEELVGSQEQALPLILDFSLPEFISHPFGFFPTPTNNPWVSEDGYFTHKSLLLGKPIDINPLRRLKQVSLVLTQ